VTILASEWSFRRVGDNLTVVPADAEDAQLANALWDFATAELSRGMRVFRVFKDYWNTFLSDPEIAQEGFSGNGTSLRLEGGRIVLCSLYDQWDDVTMSLDDFNHFLEQYESFLKESERTT
jgi:hypothetical protein